MKAEIIEGDFPKGATLASAGLFVQDVEISWVDGCANIRLPIEGCWLNL